MMQAAPNSETGFLEPEFEMVVHMLDAEGQAMGNRSKPIPH